MTTTIKTDEEITLELQNDDDIYSLPEYQMPKRDLTEFIDGQPLPTSYPDLFIRQPLPEDVIQAGIYESGTVALYRLEDKNIQRLMKYPAPESEIDGLKEVARKREVAISKEEDPARKKFLNERIETMYKFINERTAANTHVESYGAKMTGLWYLRRLLVDVDGNLVILSDLPAPTQTRLLEEIDDVLVDISLIPFVSQE